jgi:DUF438 domain-containing protein
MTTKTKKEELKNILKRLNEGEPSEEIKREAQHLLDEIDPKELSEAEQELINEGLPETELRHLCEAHIEVMAEELEALKTEVPQGHPLQILIAEHDEILDILDRLSKAKSKIEKMDSYDSNDPVFSELKELGKELLETEKHHEREEEALFPEVDKTGVTGPTRIMRMEHEDLWPRKERVDELAQNVAKMDFNKFKDDLKENTEYIVLTLRDHIYKENNILYPTAKDVIEEGKWENIEAKFDKIGYCSFTPGK